MKTIAVILAGALLLGLAACGDDDDETLADDATSPAGEINPADFTSTVDNPMFPLADGAERVYEGEETDADTGETVTLRVEETVLPERKTVGGIEVTVVEVNEYEDGELVEHTLDYYAQHNDGTVYYIGEDVDDIENGEVVGHSGEWVAGENGALPGIFMPADPQVGDEFEQERAPGIAEDQSKVVEADVDVSVPAGDFSGCIKTEDYDPIGDVTEHKFYCPDVGLVREEFEDGSMDLIESRERGIQTRFTEPSFWLRRMSTTAKQAYHTTGGGK